MLQLRKQPVTLLTGNKGVDLTMKRKINLRLLLAAFICVSLIVGAPVLSFAQTDTELAKEVRELLINNYVDPVTREVLEGETVEEILERLDDPHTTYMSREDYERFRDSIDPSFSGIGVYIEMVPEGVLVISVIPDSPAEEGGIMPGDIIITADGQEMKGLSVEEASAIIMGPEGSTVTLEIYREGTVKEFSLVRQEIEIANVTGELLGEKTGYIRVNDFGRNTGSLFEENLVSLKEKGAEKWIIDFRNNGGGYVTGIRHLLGHLVPEELAFTAENKNRDVQQEYMASSKEVMMEGPLILLVNEYSASATEITAAALKDYDRALLMGTGTYGKGSVQSLFTLSDGSFFKMTTARVYSPSGAPIDGVGVSPHLEIEGEYSPQTAHLLLGSEEEGYKVEVNETNYYVDLELARDLDYWPAYTALLEALNKEGPLWEHYYPGHSFINNLEEVSPQKVFDVSFNMSVDPQTINGDTVNLVEACTGQGVELEFIFDGESLVQVRPETELDSSIEYWLLFSDEIESKEGKQLKQPGLTTVTVGSQEQTP